MISRIQQSSIAKAFLAVVVLAQGSAIFAASASKFDVRGFANTQRALIVKTVTESTWKKYGLLLVPFYIVATNDKLSDKQLAAKKAHRAAVRAQRANKAVVANTVKSAEVAQDFRDAKDAVNAAPANPQEHSAVETVKASAEAVKAEASATVAEVKQEVKKDGFLALDAFRTAKNFVQWKVFGNLEQVPRLKTNALGEVLYNEQGQAKYTDFIPARGFFANQIVEKRIKKVICAIKGCF